MMVGLREWALEETKALNCREIEGFWPGLNCILG